jgi:Na+/H+ antiporter NhaD/arsenite permease-like protein
MEQKVKLEQLLTILLVILPLIGVAVGRYPWLRMNRATIALVGATLAVIIGALTLEQAYTALDLNTLVLLLAMMVLNVNLRLAGFFRLISTRVVRLARSPGGHGQGVNLTFTEYLKAGIPITLLSLLWGIVWLMIVS